MLRGNCLPMKANGSSMRNDRCMCSVVRPIIIACRHKLSRSTVKDSSFGADENS